MHEEEMIKWQWSTFDELSREEIYEILKIRQAIFIVEQNCAYQDADDLDQESWHLMGWRKDVSRNILLAYLRIVFPGKKYPEPSIGRVLITPIARGKNFGKILTQEALCKIESEYPNTAIRISAQRYLEKFYSQFGFKSVSEPYDEDGIPHIQMLKPAT